MSKTDWSDLSPRIISAVIMALAGLFFIWIGGLIFTVGVAAISGLMIWEVLGMFKAARGSQQIGLSIFAAVIVGLGPYLPGLLLLPAVIACAAVVASKVPNNMGLCALFSAWVIAGAIALTLLHHVGGMIWFFWLVLIVIVSDVAGYFAGRTFGGSKFWPRISPKKTWSGTIAGWIGAAIVGAFFAGYTGAGWILAPISILLAFAGQMGDIYESAMKRLHGVKDSSNLIPGHGGVLDRFDAMLGAGVCLGLLSALGLVPCLS